MMQRTNLIQTILVVLWVIQLFKITDSIDVVILWVVQLFQITDSIDAFVAIPTSKREVINFQIVDHEAFIYFCMCTNKQLDLQ